MNHKPMLLIGGYGVTGQKIARLLRRRNPRLPLVIAGRTPEKAQALADELGNASAVKADLGRPDLGLDRTEFSALALIAYDQTQNAVAFAARHGIPYLAISGAAFELCIDVASGLQVAKNTSVVIASHWYSGAVALPTLALAERFDQVDAVDIGVVIDRGEAPGGSGPATIADFERISASCPSTLVREGGRYAWVPPDAAKGKLRRADGVEIDGVGSVSCDVLSIGAATQAKTVRILEGWGVSSSRAAGGPACDEVCIRMSGRGKGGGSLKLEQAIAHPRNPTSLTAISVNVLLERMVGIAGGEALKPGFYLAEHVVNPMFFVQRLREEGVSFSGD